MSLTPKTNNIPTIRDVARRANVALSSVSRVFSDHPDVSERMRQKVQAAADELGYRPDLLAQSLRMGRTMTVGFLLRDIENPLFAAIAKRCEHDLRLAGYSMIIMSSDGDANVEANNLSVLQDRRVDGVIASLVSETEEATVKALNALTMPLVLVDREVVGLEVSAVLTDHYSGVRTAVEALLVAGHTKIGFVTGTPGVRSTNERLRAVRDAHAAAGVEVDERLLKFGAFDAQWGQQAVTELMKLDHPPTALLGGGIGPSVGTLRALRALGLEPGMDVVVIVLDEWPDFDVLSPAIPSVRREADALGVAIAREILNVLSGSDASRHTLPTFFEPRGSLPRQGEGES